jgi:hypothetical protein
MPPSPIMRLISNVSPTIVPTNGSSSASGTLSSSLASRGQTRKSSGYREWHTGQAFVRRPDASGCAAESTRVDVVVIVTAPTPVLSGPDVRQQKP